MTQWKCKALLAVMCVALAGCAAGKSATGGVVVGFDVASLPETAGEAIKVLTVRDVETTNTGQQKLAANRGHGIVQINGDARFAQYFGCHKAGRAAANDGNVASRPCCGQSGGRRG